jgi:hypothetical protein
MASAFSFGFGGDDIESDEENGGGQEPVAESQQSTSTPQTPSLEPPKSHGVADLVSRLMLVISY